MEPLSTEALSQLEAAHQRIARVSHKKGGWEVVYRRPTRDEYHAFRKDVLNPARAADAHEVLARKIVIHPDKMAFAKLLDFAPGIPEASSDSFKKLLGMEIDEFPDREKSGVSDEMLSAWESKFGRIAHIVGSDQAWEVVFRRPSRNEYKAWRAKVNDAKLRDGAQELLSKQCVIFPPREAYEALLEDFPGIPEACSEAFKDLVQIEADEAGK